MGFKEAPHPISVSQAEITESKSTLTRSRSRRPPLSPPLLPLYAVRATYTQGTQACDTEDATSENVSGSRPSLFSFNEMHPGLQETQGCRGGGIVAGQPSVPPAPPEPISQCPPRLVLSPPRGQPSSHCRPSSGLTSDCQELILQDQVLFCSGVGRWHNCMIFAF